MVTNTLNAYIVSDAHTHLIQVSFSVICKHVILVIVGWLKKCDCKTMQDIKAFRFLWTWWHKIFLFNHSFVDQNKIMYINTPACSFQHSPYVFFSFTNSFYCYSTLFAIGGPLLSLPWLYRIIFICGVKILFIVNSGYQYLFFAFMNITLMV